MSYSYKNKKKLTVIGLVILFHSLLHDAKMQNNNQQAISQVDTAVMMKKKSSFHFKLRFLSL